MAPSAGGVRAAIGSNGARLMLRSAVAGMAAIGLVERRQMHDAEHRHAAFDQRDVDGELAVARDELLGAVERIDQPEALRRLGGQALGLRLLLGDHRNVGRQAAQGGQDHRLRRQVGLGHRRLVGLALGGEVGGIDLEDLGAGVARDLGQLLGQLRQGHCHLPMKRGLRFSRKAARPS